VRRVLRHPAARSGYADGTEMVQRLEAHGNVEAIRRSCGLLSSSMPGGYDRLPERWPDPAGGMLSMRMECNGSSFFFSLTALLLAGKMKILGVNQGG